VLLAAQGGSLYEAGLRRLNIISHAGSRAFLEITPPRRLGQVLEGIELCRQIGFGPIKINAVAVKG